METYIHGAIMWFQALKFCTFLVLKSDRGSICNLNSLSNIEYLPIQKKKIIRLKKKIQLFNLTVKDGFVIVNL